MRLSFTSALTLFILTASSTVVVGSTVPRAAQNGFESSCGGFSLAGGRTFFATCTNLAGTGSQSTSIDLNGCVANESGTLECQVNGDYTSTCSGCTLEPNTATLSCNCGSGTTTKDLNDCLSNTQGSLTCP